MRLRVLASAVFVVSSTAFTQGGPRLPAWLAGCWQLDRGNRVTVEMWMPPAGGMMMGASRTVAGDAVREYEQLILKAESGKLVYTARPSGQAEASFTSTDVTDSSFVVQNPAHDFPQKISYHKRGKDSLVARIEGPGPSGTQGVDFPMRRTSCGA